MWEDTLREKDVGGGIKGGGGVGVDTKRGVLEVT